MSETSGYNHVVVQHGCLEMTDKDDKCAEHCQNTGIASDSALVHCRRGASFGKSEYWPSWFSKELGTLTIPCYQGDLVRRSTERKICCCLLICLLIEKFRWNKISPR